MLLMGSIDNKTGSVTSPELGPRFPEEAGILRFPPLPDFAGSNLAPYSQHVVIEVECDRMTKLNEE